MKKIKMELHHDHFQNFKRYNVPRAQLVIADIPYNLGNNAYASSNQWYIDGDNKNGESKLANTSFFKTDENFNLNEYMHFCSKLLKKEPKQKNDAPAMIVFCSFEQMPLIVELGKKHGFKKSYPLFFIKNTSSQVLNANMKIVGATEHAIVLYRDKLPKFRNGKTEDTKGKMIKNWFEWKRDSAKEYPKVHPTQKPVNILKQLIEIFTDEGDVVVDPFVGVGWVAISSYLKQRKFICWEIDESYYNSSLRRLGKIDKKFLKKLPKEERPAQQQLF